MATIKTQVIIGIMGGGHVEPHYYEMAYRRGHLITAEGWGLLHSGRHAGNGQRFRYLTKLRRRLQMPPDGFRQKKIIRGRDFNVGTASRNDRYGLPQAFD